MSVKDNLLKEINFIAHSKGVDLWARRRLKLLHRTVHAQNREIERLRAALRRAHLWLSTTGMDATPDEIATECAAALDLDAHDGCKPGETMKPLTDDDFPVSAIDWKVYRRTDHIPICDCADSEIATEIAKRLNRDNQRHPDGAESLQVNVWSNPG